MKKKILPINDKPSIITCIHHSYPCAIIESLDLGDILIDKYEEYEWNNIERECVSQIVENKIRIYQKGEKIAQEILWRKSFEVDEQIIKINYIKPRNISRYVDVFVTDDDIWKEVNLVDKTCGIRWNQYGLFIGKKMYNFDTSVYIYVKLCREKYKISVYTSKDGIIWKFVDFIIFPEKFYDILLNIGIHFHLGEDNFIKWKNMNFIQLVYNKDNIYKGISLDYYLFPRKNIDNSYSSYISFLDTHYDSLYDVKDIFASTQDYICWNIDHFYYVNICLDEYYVNNRAAYNSEHYNHYNLFYGYDDYKRVFYIMGYDEKSFPVIGEISYDVFEKEIITKKDVVRYKYCCNEVSDYKFDVAILNNSLYEFINNVDSSFKISNILIGEPLWYGIDIIKAIANSEIENLKEDKRIAFCLSEHSKLMRDRIIFLYINNYLQENDYNCLLSKSDILIQNTAILLNLILKNKRKKIEGARLRDILLIIYANERDLCSNLLEVLKQK